MKVSDPSAEDSVPLCNAPTAAGYGALVTVLKNGLLQTLGGVQRLLGRPGALRDHRPERARRPGKEVVPREYRQSSRRSYRWPAGPGTEG
jgi:hypothetical protein